MEKDNKKAAQEKARYERELKEINKTKTKAQSVLTSDIRRPSINSVDQALVIHETPDEITDPIEREVERVKNKVKTLNPLRRARRLFTDESGHNNPNIEGQDNGLNAWLDTQLNTSDFDQEQLVDAGYAKRNSDMNRCFNIDDIPTRGPPTLPEVNSNASFNEIERITQELMDDDNLSICRATGILKNEAISKTEIGGNKTSRGRYI